MRYRMISRDTRAKDWEPGEITLSGEELDLALDYLIRATTICYETVGKKLMPVFLSKINEREMMYIAFEEIIPPQILEPAK